MPRALSLPRPLLLLLAFVFAAARLIEAVRAHAALPPAELLATLARTVAEFSGREQEDDLTFLVARAV